MGREIYRLKFIKIDRMKFIGHLDLLKLFQRTLKKSDLPIAYSEGYNPHQKVAFALPLSLGFSSEGEYVDIQFTEEIDVSKLQKVLNMHFPDGISVTKIIKQNGGKNAASVLAYASYEIEFPFAEDFKTAAEYINNKNEIIIEKKNKKGITKEIDIKSDILKAEVISNNKILILISAGSDRNLKPEAVAKLFLEYFKKDFEDYKFKIRYKRLEMFEVKENKLVALDGAEVRDEKFNR